MDSILDLLEINSEDATQLYASLKSSIQKKTIPKGTILQQQGEPHTKGYFVKKGLLRSYTIDDKGKEHVFMFAPEGWIISDIESQAMDVPTELYIDAVENSEIEILDRNWLNGRKIPPQIFQSSGHKLLKRIAVLQKRVIMLMSASAEERYQHFLKTYPQIVNRVPQKMIASYLGITPEALSTTKRKIFKKK